MKLEKTIDVQEKSMQKVFDALTKHLQKYPNDFATLYVGQKRQIDGNDRIEHSCFIFEGDQEHFYKSHIWHLFMLMQDSGLDVLKQLHNGAMQIYTNNNKI